MMRSDSNRPPVAVEMWAEEVCGPWQFSHWMFAIRATVG
jgi:hypothetical protein